MSIFENLLSKADLLIMFVGFVALLWKAMNALQSANSENSELTKIMAKLMAGVPAQVPAPSVPVNVVPTPPALPAPSGPFDGFPVWFQKALPEIGTHEEGSNRGAAIQRYINLAHCGSLGDPWCAIFANAMFEEAGVTGSRSASSQSFRTNPNFVQLSGPAKGCIVVFWRGSKTSGLGHIGFYRGENASSIWTLGGNENDMVQIEALPKDSATFGLIGYWWPASVPLPQIGPVTMPAGSPVSVQAPPSGSAPAASTSASGAAQTNITATYFGGQQSAYGGPIDDNSPGVALPFRFTGVRPRVRVTSVKSGVSVDCDIVDIGPWNINDPYWQKGSRPEAETGTDNTGRHTNGAGIDLTLAAAKAVGIDGKGLVNWQFIEPTTSPNVA